MANESSEPGNSRLLNDKCAVQTDGLDVSRKHSDAVADTDGDAIDTTMTQVKLAQLRHDVLQLESALQKNSASQNGEFIIFLHVLHISMSDLLLNAGNISMIRRSLVFSL